MEAREAEIQARVREWLENQGCIVRKQTTFGAFGTVGFPDLAIFMHDCRVWFLEIKVEGKLPTNVQYFWIDKLRRYGFRADIITSLQQVKDLYAERYAQGGHPPAIQLGKASTASPKPRIKRRKKTKGGE
jgi:G:T-mismatch repair DNA endonuclease (very short patch repair protein)